MSRQDAWAGNTASVCRVFDELDIASLDGKKKNRVICAFWATNKRYLRIQRTMIRGVGNRRLGEIESRAACTVSCRRCLQQRKVAVFDLVRSVRIGHRALLGSL